ncbi:MAG: hypothetical protein CK541_02990 [Opitutia bacterium]|nr:hypothetical protein [Opitutales bacterium]PHX79809.1 MAG: hypothetical protein CK541_02990 [Opitutae bacterium]
MKNILPILTLTTLAAAASAQVVAPAAAGLNYNRVGLGYNTDTKGYSLSATAVLGSSNFWVGASSTIGGAAASNGTDSVAIGYLFANVYAGIDAAVSVASNEAYNLGLRKALGNNFEAAASFGRNSADNNVWGVELAYNVSKQIQLAVGYSDAQGAASTSDLTVRYNF